MEEKIWEGKGEKLKAQDQDGETGRRIEKVSTVHYAPLLNWIMDNWINRLMGSIGEWGQSLNSINCLMGSIGLWDQSVNGDNRLMGSIG